jgi:hypothetical protein
VVLVADDLTAVVGRGCLASLAAQGAEIGELAVVPQECTLGIPLESIADDPDRGR